MPRPMRRTRRTLPDMTFAPATPSQCDGRDGGVPAEPPPAAASRKLAEMSAEEVAALPDETLELIAATVIHLDIKLASSPRALDTRMKLYRAVWIGLEARRPDLLTRIKAKVRRKRDENGWPHPAQKPADAAIPTPAPTPAQTPIPTPITKDTRPPANDNGSAGPANRVAVYIPAALSDADFDQLPDSELAHLAALAKHVLIPSAESPADLARLYDDHRILFCAIDRRWPLVFRELADLARKIRNSQTGTGHIHEKGARP